MVLGLYASFYLTENDLDYILLSKNIELALETSLFPNATLALINLYAFLKFPYNNDLPSILNKLWKPLKRVMNDHHFDKLCAIQTLHCLLMQNFPLGDNVWQSNAKDIIQRLKIKQNEPTFLKKEKLQFFLDIFKKFQCQLAMKELISTTKNPKKSVKLEAIKALGECGLTLS